MVTRYSCSKLSYKYTLFTEIKMGYILSGGIYTYVVCGEI